ncbi:hypothetical protein [Mycolicibacterium llatzerense]|uniref:hypothetical protein n=1 Tax=Mycolicibacterium llatzerense TaxID=280871 RepID=UPI0031E09389
MTAADPTTAIDTATAAMHVAKKLLAAANDDPSATAAGALAALLYGASPARAGGGIAWVQQILAMPGRDTLDPVIDVLGAGADDRRTIHVLSAWVRSVTTSPPRAQQLRAEIVAALAPYITASAS